jgi:hypothetical protein
VQLIELLASVVLVSLCLIHGVYLTVYISRCIFHSVWPTMAIRGADITVLHSALISQIVRRFHEN